MSEVALPPAGSTNVNVFVTGQPGVGKTSLVLNVARKLPQHLIAGFYTVEARSPQTNEKIGYDVVTLTGEVAPLCRVKKWQGNRVEKVGKFYVALDEFEHLVMPTLMPSPDIKLHVIDEVGRLELCSQPFADAVMALLASPETVVFGSLPAPRYRHTIDFVEDIKQRPDTAVLTLNKNNRDATAVQVESLLSRLLEGDHSSSPAQQEAPKPSLEHGTEGPAVSHQSGVSGFEFGQPATGEGGGEQLLPSWPEEDEGEGETSAGTFSFVEGVMVDEPPGPPDWISPERKGDA